MLKIKLAGLTALVALFMATGVSAQTSVIDDSLVGTDDAVVSVTTESGATVVVEDATVDTVEVEVVTEDLDGIEVEEVKKMPSRFSLWWKGVKETASIVTTIDPVSKAEKRIKFAEERMRLADFIAENATDDKRKAWAERMVEKSGKHIEKLEATRTKWENHPNAAKRKLLKNVATYQVRKDKFLDRIEERMPEKRKDAFEKLREKSSERGKRVMKALDNKNVPDDVKKHIRAVKTRVEAKHEEIIKFQLKKKDIIKKIQAGDETAKDALKKLQNTRHEAVKKRVEEHKDFKTNLRKKAENGDDKAKERLRTINKMDAKVKNKIAPKSALKKPEVVKKLRTVKPVPVKPKAPPAVKPVPTKAEILKRAQQLKANLEKDNTEAVKQ